MPMTPVSVALQLSTQQLRLAMAKIGLFTIGSLLIFLDLNGPANVWLSFAVLFALLLFPILLQRWKGDRDLVKVINIFVIVYFVAFWLRPLVAIFDFEAIIHPFARRTDVRQEDIGQSVVLAAVALCAVYLGFYSRIGRKVGRVFPVRFRGWRVKRVHAIVAICPFVIIPLWVYMFSQSGFSVEFMWEHRSELLFAGRGDVYYLMKLAMYVLAMLVFCTRISQGKETGRWIAFVVPLMLALPIMAFGDRGVILTLLLPPLVVWHYHVRRFGVGRLTVLAIVLYGVVFFVGTIRGGYGFRAFETKITDLVVMELGAQFSYWDNLLVLLKHFPEKEPFYYGRIMAGDLLSLVPRVIWPGKPRTYGTNLVQDAVFPGAFDPVSGAGHYDAFSTIGLGYVDFGYVGAIVAAFVLGLFFRALEESFGGWKARGNPLGAALYGAGLLGAVLVMRGFVMHILGALMFLIPAGLIFKYVSGAYSGKTGSNVAPEHRR